MKTFILFLSTLFVCIQVYSQQIQNVEYFLENKNIIITYELMDCTNNDLVDISIEFVEQSNQKIIPKFLSGDIKNVSCGSKKIVWHVNNDNIDLNGRYQVVLNYKISPKGVVDIDGNVYKTVKIGNQIWFAENLKTSKYSDGTQIPNITNNNDWKNNTTGAWSYYNNDTKNDSIYGKLYNWYSINKNTNGNHNVCPEGWHVPSTAEWTILYKYLGGIDVAGGKMKEIGLIHWDSPNIGADNSSLFTGIPAGFRYYDGGFQGEGYYCSWWSSSVFDNSLAFYTYIYRDDTKFEISKRGKGGGDSIRCVKN